MVPRRLANLAMARGSVGPRAVMTGFEIPTAVATAGETRAETSGFQRVRAVRHTVVRTGTFEPPAVVMSMSTRGRASAMNVQSMIVELQATGVRYFSQGDEAAFFRWLKELPFVDHFEGRGLTLYIKVDSLAVDEEGLRELLALFHRYNVDLAQLVVFDRDEFVDWFRRADAYWYKDIFG